MTKRLNLHTLKVLTSVTVIFSMVSLILFSQLRSRYNKERSLKAWTLQKFRTKLKKLGYEPVEDHAFKSPFIINPNLYPQVKRANQTTKIISIYNCPKFFKNDACDAYNKDFKDCEYKCILDLEGHRHLEADVLVFFTGYRSSTQPVRPPGQIWVKAMWESPTNYVYPGNFSQWRNVFNWTFNYRVDSDIFAPNNLFAWRDRDQLLSKKTYLEIARNKTKMAVWWVSNCYTQSKREIFTKELKKYIDVDIFGYCGPLNCPKATKEECEKMLTTTYRFYLSFENSLCRDYVTEKFFRNFNRHHVIPVARGGFNYRKYIPPGGYVDASQFPNASSLARHLKKLAANKKKYAKMLREKDKLVPLNRKFDWCDICKKVHTNNRTKVIPNIAVWSHYNKCQKARDL
ncbi:alpha-(1,3)-fucosyltransferase C-like [Physella acuta]|uniref:alpha-(1,3)-fucosyltransferase C-like n=1 Tax=Physella acuta TaxID=109671 RepID=UPI0027DD1289|nr:alpha-(1,3)-fucosyltransferase C-like [Physella acuta]